MPRSPQPRPTPTTCPAGPRSACATPSGSGRGRMHRRGLAVTTYLNPMVCTGYHPVFDDRGCRRRADRGRGRASPTCSAIRPRPPSTSPSSTSAREAGREGFASVAGEAIEDGYDGWMEDFGEYTPLDSADSAGTPGTASTILTRAGTTAPPSRAWRLRRAADRPLSALGLDRRRALRAGRLGRGPDHLVGIRRIALLAAPGAQHGALRRQPLGLGHRRLLRPVREPAHTGAAEALGPARRGLGRDAHRGRRDRHPAEGATRRSGTRIRSPTGAATRSCAPSSIPTLPPPRRPTAAGHAADAPALARLSRRPDRGRARGRVPLRPRPAGRAGARAGCEDPPSLPAPRALARLLALARLPRERRLIADEAARLLRGGRARSDPGPARAGCRCSLRAGTILPSAAGRGRHAQRATGIASTTALAERRRQPALLAFPRGSQLLVVSTTRADPLARERAVAGRCGSTSRAGETYDLQASMRTLKEPFAPCAVSVDGRRCANASWSYEQPDRRALDPESAGGACGYWRADAARASSVHSKVRLAAGGGDKGSRLTGNGFQ